MMMHLKKMFCTAMLASAVAGALLAAVPAQTATAPASAASRPGLLVEDPTKPSPVRSNTSGATNNGWVNRHNGFVATAKKGGIDLYMEGDSITDFWMSRFRANWDKNLGPWKPGDFGISGDRTQNVLYRIANGELDGVNPKVVVVLIGTNNLALNAVYGINSVDDTVKGVKAVVAAIKEKAPGAKVLLIAIMPRNDPPPKAPPDIWANICKVNAEIAKLDDGKTLRFLDFNDKLADKDGKLVPGVMGNDNLHPSEKGYQIWFEAMKPILTEWLGEPGAATGGATVPAK